jgi:hypothetical protein
VRPGVGCALREAADRLDAASDEHVAFTGFDRLRGTRHGLEPRTAQPIHRLARDFDRQPCEQQRHAGHVAVVFAGLVGAAQNHVVDARRIDARALHDRLDGDGGQIVGAHLREAAAVLADGRPQRGVDQGVGHRATQTVFVSR